MNYGHDVMTPRHALCYTNLNGICWSCTSTFCRSICWEEKINIMRKSNQKEKLVGSIFIYTNIMKFECNKTENERNVIYLWLQSYFLFSFNDIILIWFVWYGFVFYVFYLRISVVDCLNWTYQNNMALNQCNSFFSFFFFWYDNK